MDPSQLLGKTFGPHTLNVTAERVADFIAVTGDDPDRWTDVAPPGFAAAALFEVAPDLLDQVHDRSVIHGEQTFTWYAPIRVGFVFDVTGEVTRARERGGVHFVNFELQAASEAGRLLGGTSLFVLSGESLPGRAEFERPEPQHSYRGALELGQVAASRDDLVRYAAATRDWNPIHWDHDAAVAAGLPGVVVHGLLQSGWAFAAVTRQVQGNHPLANAKVRFRNPLLPARPAVVSVKRDNGVFDVIISDELTTYMTARVEASDE